MKHSKSVEFFERQFRRQVQQRDMALNPFEKLAMDYLQGTILDLGAGLGNLSLAAARRGHRVTAVDASPVAVNHINTEAHRECLSVHATLADLSTWNTDESFDTIVAIGLLMFFRAERALELLRSIQTHVAPSGRAIVNALVEGTTFMSMFDPDNYHLFGSQELDEQFANWEILVSRHQAFPAPGETVKKFATIVAEKPS